jgi:DNA end-binding protein Ku
MPRPIWNGSIAFGLVNVPVKLFSATSPKDVRFHQLRKSDSSRVRQKRVSAADGTEVPYEEIVKGYEIAPEQYVVIEPDELNALDPKATQTIDIEEFVSLDQIDPIFYENAYYLVPDKRSEKAYALLTAAMAETGKVAIAKFVMRTKQYLAAVRPDGGALVLSTMLYADEVVPVDSIEGLPAPGEIDLSDKELQMAEALIDSLTADRFEPEKFHDDYRERVLELIDAKAQGQTIVAAPAPEVGARVVDLMAALEASVKAAKERRAAGSPSGSAPAKVATASRPPRAAAKTTAKAAAKRAAPVVEEAEEPKPARSRRRKTA